MCSSMTSSTVVELKPVTFPPHQFTLSLAKAVNRMRSCVEFSKMLLLSMIVAVFLQLVFVTPISARVIASSSPAQIEVGLSLSLEVNCSFSNDGSSGMAEIISLTLSRGNNTELAIISTRSDHQVNVMSSEGITADGVISPGGQSYIHLHWEYPTDTQEGTYQCVARGLDPLGHIVETVNTTVVNADKPQLGDLIDEMTKMQIYIKQLEAKVLSNEARASSNEIKIANQMSAVFLLPPLSYNNKSYYVSKAGFQDYEESITICKAYGGILVEIDDLAEYHTIQNYWRHLTVTNTGVSRVYIAGSDEAKDLHRVLPTSNDDLPFVDWCCSSEPFSGASPDNCLELRGAHGWKMVSVHCHVTSVNPSIRYMCELDNN